MTGSLLAVLKDRLAEVEQGREAISEELGRLEEVAAALSDESLHLRALIERHEVNRLASGQAVSTQDSVGPSSVQAFEDRAETLPPTNLGLASPNQVPGEQQGSRWLVVATEVLQRAGGPLHYRELHKRMKAMGAPSFGGQNPLATFLAAVSRESARSDSPLVRVGRGEYALATHPDDDEVKRVRGKRLSRSSG
jgi:hypothetical protein